MRERTKIKCGDLDSPFWEWMQKYDFCELKKLPTRPQCGEGRKKCGMPGSHCQDRVCSTACGVGKPECPDGFHFENGECEDLEEKREKSSPVDGSADSHSGPKNSTSLEEDGKGSHRCAEEMTSCSGNSFCAEEECHQSKVAADGPCRGVCGDLC